MIDYEIKISKQSADWKLEIYDPNYWSVVGTTLKNFHTNGEAKCWAEAWSDKVEVFQEGTVIYAKISYDFDIEKLLTTL